MNISNLSLSKALFLFDFFTVFFLVEKFYLKSLFKFDGFSFWSWSWRLCRLDRFTIIMIDLMEKFRSFSRFKIIIRGQFGMRDFNFSFFLFRKITNLSERTRKLLNIFQDLNYFLSLWNFWESRFWGLLMSLFQLEFFVLRRDNSSFFSIRIKVLLMVLFFLEFIRYEKIL